MDDLIVSIEKKGVMRPVGRIFGKDSSDSCFAYSDDYLNSRDAAVISLSLPLQSEPFSPERTRSFFEGLLPESVTRRIVSRWMRVEEDDYLPVLHYLGRELPGALRVLRAGERCVPSYTRLTEADVRALAAEGAAKSAEMLIKARLSLSGASGKASLYYHPDHGAWYLPLGGAPATHVFKQSQMRCDGIVINEQLSLMTAARCGIDIARSFSINTGGGEDKELLFAVERYDRQFAADGRKIDGLPCPQRLHREDFAQALGIPASEKYEKGARGYLRAMFELLRRFSSDPINDQLKLWDLLVFCFLIGNTDCHMKNFSLLYSPNLKTVRLAPACGIVSSSVYGSGPQEMAVQIGGARLLKELTRDSFELAAKEVGLGRKMALRRFDALCGKFEPALQDAAAKLAEAGFPRASGLAERILETGGIRNLSRTNP